MKRVSMLLLIVVVGLLFSPQAAPAQAAKSSHTQPLSILVDTDTGVDDALAIGYLLSQRRQSVEVLGISAVAGNTDVDNAANNVLTVLDAAGATTIPVAIGASQPLSRTLSHTGKLIHGPDGLWFAGMSHPHDLSGLSRDVPTFYRDMLAENPGATIVTLGPLTNIAQTIQRYPTALSNVSRIVILGGAKAGGNQTPVSEYNMWQDPEAASIVLASGLPIEIVTMDAFTTLTINNDDINELRTDGNAVGQLLADPLTAYAQVQTGLGGLSAAGVPDVAAMIDALEPGLAERQSALVDIVAEPRIVQGQTIIGLSLSEKIPMITDDTEMSDLVDRFYSEPGFDLFAAIGAILVRRADNAQVVLNINERRMHSRLMQALTN